MVCFYVFVSFYIRGVIIKEYDFLINIVEFIDKNVYRFF